MEFLKFEPLLKQTIWGGDKIIPFKHLEKSLDQVGESWEVSGVKDNETVVANGEYKGWKLNDVLAEQKELLVGKENYARYGNLFPLLIKFIDARQQLSIQVHPNDEQAQQKGLPRGKTEMWYVMKSDPTASLRSGLKQQITPEEYKQMVAERGIAENVDFLGYRRDINNLVGLSDLSVASSFQEGLPINLIEAMAMGNPIVATDVRGNNDAVEDGVNGYLVPVGDSGMMAEKILELMNDREKLRTFGENGLDMVRDFSTENVNREMLTIYSNLGLI